MYKKYSITQIDHKRSTDENWEAYFKVRSDCANRDGIPLLFNDWIELKENTLLWLKTDFGLYMVSEGDQSIGYFTFSIRLKNEVDRRFVFLKNGTKKDFDKALLKGIYKAFIEFDPLSKFLVISSINGQYDFLEEDVNAEIGDYVEQFELNVAKAKTRIINEWYEVYSEKFKDFELRHYEDIPDDLLEEYCTIFLELLEDMPDESKISDYTNINPQKTKERQIKGRKQNDCSYRYLVFDGSKLIAKTNVALNKKNPQSMYQYMTGVTQKYRKSGIGKWLKAAMFIKLMKDFPDLEVILTEIHVNNIASKKLSMQMGYEKTGVKKEYLISKKSIEKALMNQAL